MAKNDSYLKMTADDLRAARILTLAVKFFGTSRPVSSLSIRADLYPSLDEKSFKRQFLRDRELLSSFGIVIHEAESDGSDTLWQIDERLSYVQGESLSAGDARMLYVLCHDMTFDQAFPYRDELRMALAKIARMYRGTTISHTDVSSPTEHKILSVLVSCMTNRHAASITYTDAHDATSNRTVALLGSFGLREKTYFVASRVKKDGSLVPDSIRTYRLDRFDKARELPRVSYVIPLDFSVSDYERLPFQMGDSQGTASFLVGKKPGKQVRHALSTHGRTKSVQDRNIWTVPFSNAYDVASWAVASSLLPLEPQEVCDAWTDILTRAAHHCAYDASLAGYPDDPVSPVHTKHAGRTGSVSIARQLVALAGSLTHEGEVITANDIANTLGVSFDDARHLIALVSMGSGESIDYLPVILGDEDEEVSLMEGAALSGRRIRLTRSESIALTAALSELGVDENDPLVRTLKESYTAPSFSSDDILRSLEEPSSASDSKVLRKCSRAIVSKKGLSFEYRPVTGGAPSRREVVPHFVRRTDDSWYLDAFDLTRQDTRVFRIDRMSDVYETNAQMPDTSLTKPRETQLITVHFADRHYLDLFYWDGLQVLSSSQNEVIARIPYYGGSWLVHHLSACADTLTLDNEDIAKRMRAYAQALLAENTQVN